MATVIGSVISYSAGTTAPSMTIQVEGWDDAGNFVAPAFQFNTLNVASAIPLTSTESARTAKGKAVDAIIGFMSTHFGLIVNEKDIILP
jgi:hypothetical protein